MTNAERIEGIKKQSEYLNKIAIIGTIGTEHAEKTLLKNVPFLLSHIAKLEIVLLRVKNDLYSITDDTMSAREEINKIIPEASK